MPATGLEVFDKTIQTTNIWLDEIMAELGPDRHVAWHTMGAVLHALRDRLPPDEAADLAAQLPMMVRGLFYDQYRPSHTPERLRHIDEFLERVRQELRGTRPVDPRDAVRTVFGVLSHHIAPGEVEDVRNVLPEEVARLVEDVGRDGEDEGAVVSAEERRAAAERARRLRQLRARLQNAASPGKAPRAASKPRGTAGGGKSRGQTASTSKPRRKTAAERAAAEDPGRGGERPDRRTAGERARPRDTGRQGS